MNAAYDNAFSPNRRYNVAPMSRLRALFSRTLCRRRPRRHGSACVVVGAGASYGARLDFPGSDPPPLGDDLAGYLLHWYATNERIGRLVRGAGALELADTDYERPAGYIFDRNALDREGFRQAIDWLRQCAWDGSFEDEALQLMTPGSIEEDKNSLRRTLWHVLAFAMLNGAGCRFREGPDLYDDLVEWLSHRFHEFSFISFNYDILLEEAIIRKTGCKPRYPGLRLDGYPDNATGPDVFKPHGSVNWFTLDHSEEAPNFAKGPQGQWIADHRFEYPLPRTQTIAKLKTPSHFAAPVTCVYCPGKPATVNHGGIEDVRAKALEAVRAADRVLLIGLRPPQERFEEYERASEGVERSDDPFLVSLCAVLRPVAERVFVVNPSERDLDGFGQWLPRARLSAATLGTLVSTAKGEDAGK